MIRKIRGTVAHSRKERQEGKAVTTFSDSRNTVQHGNWEKILVKETEVSETRQK